jgi:hypothetical protein
MYSKCYKHCKTVHLWPRPTSEDLQADGHNLGCTAEPIWSVLFGWHSVDVYILDMSTAMLQRILPLLFISWTVAYTQLCRCQCGTNYTVIPLQLDGVDLTCNNCTRKYCVEHANEICGGADEFVTSTSCFQRESELDRLVIYSFLSVTSILLMYALFMKLRARAAHQLGSWSRHGMLRRVYL